MHQWTRLRVSFHCHGEVGSTVTELVTVNLERVHLRRRRRSRWKSQDLDLL